MSTLLEKANQILTEKETKILSENIKQGITAFGVTGTLTTVNNQNKTVTENGVVTPDTGYTGLGEVTVEVDSIPDGIFIQETTPTKTTNEALWLSESTITDVKIDLTLLPPEVLVWTDINGDRTLGDIISSLTSAQISTINNYQQHVIFYDTDGKLSIFASDKIYLGDHSGRYSFGSGGLMAGVSSNGYFADDRSYDRINVNINQNYISDVDIKVYGTTIIHNNANEYLNTESGVHIDVNNTRYIVRQSKLGTNTFTKILDTSDADATSGDILTGKTAFVNNQKVTGTMSNNGTINITPSTTQQVIPAGYTSGGTVSGDANLVQANIRSGVTIFGVEGNLEPDKPDQTKTITPSATQQVVEPDVGYELSSVTVNPIPLNIYCQDSYEGWSSITKKDIPFSSYNSAYVTIGTDVYLFGGISQTKVAYKYDMLTDTYTKLTNVPGDIRNGSATFVGTDIYLFEVDGNPSLAYKYDTLTDTYTQLANMPYTSNSFSGGIAEAIGTDVYLFGGTVRNNGNSINIAYKYDTLTDTYTQLTNMPYTATNLAGLAVGTDIYLFGGYSTVSGNQAKAYKYDTLTDTYTQLAGCLDYIMDSSAAKVNDNIYLFGNSYTSSHYKNAYKYSITTNSWTRVDNIPYDFKAGATAVLNSIIYLFGGGSNPKKVQVYDTFITPENKNGLWLKSNLTPSEIITDDTVTLDPYWNIDKMSELNTIPFNFTGRLASIGTDVYLFFVTTAYKYDTLTDTYTQLTDIPYTFNSGGVVSMGTDIYLFGGVSSLNNAYKYDTLTDTYSQLTDIPYNFADGDVILIDTNVYLIGSAYSLKQMWKYNIMTDSYTELTTIPYNCARESAVAVETDIYIFGGSESSNRTTAYKYDTTTDTYTQLSNIPYPFYYAAVISVGADIYLFGSGYYESSKKPYNKYCYKYDTLTDTYIKLTDIPYGFDNSKAILVGADIYLFGGPDYPTKVQVFTFPNKSYTSNSIVIENGTTYSTDLIPTNVTNGLPYKFKNFYYYTTTGGLDTEIEKYYGDGTQWNKIN